ncbi:MAG TPA: selenocysteine-specific translation elongation factor [Gemmatimonadaceae bacterium]
MILGTAGHIDHGKTALVKALTGVDTDRLPEEKRRGITIDLGFAPLVIEGIGTVGIVDVPGHEAFVRTMLAGASGIDIALLVVAADEGVMPQTREHVQILSLLGIPKLVVALTKSDLVTAEWLELAADDIRSLLADTSFALSEVIPVSAVTGAGVNDVREAIRRAALETTTIGCDAKGESSNRGLADDLFRMPVDRAFTIKGTGTVVTGTVWSGRIGRDATVNVFPPGKQSRVRGVQHHGAAVKTAGPGERVALALTDLDVAEVSRGSVVVADDSWPPTSRVEAEITITDSAVEIGPRTRLRFHLGTSDVGARISGTTRDRKNDGSRFVATIVLDEPLLVRGGDRFVIRLPSPSITIGGGRIRDPFPRRRPSRARPATESHSEALARMAANAGFDGLAIGILPVRLGITPADAAQLSRSIGLLELRSRVYDPAVLEDLEQTIESAITKHVETFPLDPGVQLHGLRSLVQATDALIDLALDRLATRKRIEIRQSVAKPAGWTAKLSDRERVLADAMMHEICIRPREPPTVSELAASFGDKVPALLRYLERTGELVRVSDERYYSPGAVALMVGKLRSTLEPSRVYTPAELREVLGVSRKYLIPFLEFCDVTGITDRRAEGRVLGAAPLVRG